MEENNDTWSLLAVVRECSRKVRNKAPEPNHSSLTTPEPQIMPNSMSFVETNTNGSFDELLDLCKPFLVPSSYSESRGSNSKSQLGCDFSGVTVPPCHVFQAPEDQVLLQQQGFQVQSQKGMGSCCPVGIHKKKKFEERRVCRMRLDELSEDKWAWRKYGQKPIKGSPYPRNYYRCSSSKGCTARKQVERSPIDPNTYLVTYTGHHYHARPPIRSSSMSRAKALSPAHPSDPTSSPEREPDKNGMGLGFVLGEHDKRGSGLEFVSKEPMVKVENEEDGCDEEADMTPNSMAESDLLIGMERLTTVEKLAEQRKGSQNGYGFGYGFGYEYEYEYEYEMIREVRTSVEDPK